MVIDGTREERCDVAVVGGGPAGLSAAVRLRELGVDRVTVIEREAAAGGIPRHCGHPPFGVREFRRIMKGPAYARALVRVACEAGVDIRTGTDVVSVEPGGDLVTTSDHGVIRLKAERVLLATGVRETPRSARLISGGRPGGVITTGTLQSMIYLKSMRPFSRPVIVGTELVAFSALLTCRHGDIRPVAMIEERSRVTARSFSAALPALMRIPIYRRSRLNRILGVDQVEGVELRSDDGELITLPADGIILTGGFTPESTLIRMGRLDLDPATGGPLVDGFGRCSDPTYFAAGNVLRPVETAGWCWREGREIASAIHASLSGTLPDPSHMIAVRPTGGPVRYAMPGRIAPTWRPDQMTAIQIRFAEAAAGHLRLAQGERQIWSKHLNGLPERRILVPLRDLVDLRPDIPIDVGFDPA